MIPILVLVTIAGLSIGVCIFFFEASITDPLERELKHQGHNVEVEEDSYHCQGRYCYTCKEWV